MKRNANEKIILMFVYCVQKYAFMKFFETKKLITRNMWIRKYQNDVSLFTRRLTILTIRIDTQQKQARIALGHRRCARMCRTLSFVFLQKFPFRMKLINCLLSISKME